MKPKVLVGAPISDNHKYCIKEYLESIRRLTYDNFDVFFIDNSEKEDFADYVKKEGFSVIKAEYHPVVRERMVNSRNILREKMLNSGYDYFFNIDQDVIVPPDIIQSFLKHSKEIITGIYYGIIVSGGKEKAFPVIYKSWDKEEIEYFKSHLEEMKIKRKIEYKFIEENNFNYSKLMRFFSVEEVEEPKLIEVRACGTGCIFINRTVLEKIKFRFEGDKFFDDYFFCEDAIKNNYKIYADTGIKCRHLIRDRPWSWNLTGKDIEMKFTSPQ